MGPELEKLAEAYSEEVFKNWLLLIKHNKEKDLKKKQELRTDYSNVRKRLKEERAKITQGLSPEEKMEFNYSVNLKSNKKRGRISVKTPETRKKRRKIYKTLYKSTNIKQKKAKVEEKYWARFGKPFGRPRP
ncbi:MAG: hypothetical protein AB1467_01715 [Candidatus Diapherotrites archaeon]